MIGQEKLKEVIDTICKTRGLPRFTIITGRKGQGKKTLVREVAKRFNYLIVEVGNKVDDIREAIELSYKQTEPIIYLLADADDMSLGAKNSLLKVIEEPSQRAYFMMTLEQIENTLETIKSRAYVLNMEEYTDIEKQQMITELLPNRTVEEKNILHIANNYGQMQKIISYGTLDFYNYVEKVYKNIYKVQSANSFKLAEKLDLKNDNNGYDLELFFIFYNYFVGINIYDCEDAAELNCLYDCVSITCKYKNLLSTKGINRQMLVDMWILDIRKAWLSNEAK